MSARKKYRAPKDYDPVVIDRTISKIYDDMNRLDTRVGQLQRTRRDAVVRQSSDESLVPRVRAEFYQVEEGGTDYIEGRVIVEAGASGIIAFRARASDEGDLANDELWTDISGSFIADSTYKGGGYYRFRVAIAPVSEEKGLIVMQLQALGAGDELFLDAQHTFDRDRAPRIRSLALRWGIFNGSTGKWPLYADAAADEDTASIAFGVGTSAFSSTDSLVLDASLSAGTVNARVVEAQLVGSFSPSPIGGPPTIAYAVVAAYSGAAKAGVRSRILGREQAEVPNDPRDPSLINSGSVLSSQLEDVAKRVHVDISMTPSGVTPSSVLSYGGSIRYADGTNYVMSPDPQGITLSTGGLHYLYFDPAVDANSLSVTTDPAIAKAVTGRRAFVGLARRATAPESAFHVVTSDEPTISTPVLNVVRLSAISADMGTITAGSGTFTSGSNTLWVNPDSSPGVLAVGSTAGGVAAAPFHVAADGTTTLSKLVAVGYGQIQRSISAPATRADGTSLAAGDIWIDTDDGNRPYSWDGSAWIEQYTAISGNHIVTGAIESVDWSTADGMQVDLDAGTITIGGSSAPVFSWNGTVLSVTGGITLNSASTLSSTLAITGAGKVTIGSMGFGYNVNGTNDGLYIDGNNFWYDTGIFTVGDGSKFLAWNGTDVILTGQIKNTSGTVIYDPAGATGTGTLGGVNLTDLSLTGTLTVGGGTLTSTTSNMTLAQGTGTLFVTGQGVDIGAGAIFVNEDDDSVAISALTVSLASSGFGSSISIEGLTWPSADGTAGQFLKTDGAGALSWDTAGGGSTTLGGLSDVTITSAATGDILRYNGTAWVDYPDSNYATSSHSHDVDGSGITGYGAISNTWAWGSGTSTIVTIAPGTGITVSNSLSSDTVSITKDSITINSVSVSLFGHGHAIGDITGFTDNSTNWDTAYGWGNHATAGYTEAGDNISIFTNNSGYTTNTGTVTSVGGTGSTSGLSLSGTVTTSGNITLGGSVTSVSQAAVTAHQAALSIGSAQIVMAGAASDNLIASDELGVPYVTGVDVGDVLLKSTGLSGTMKVDYEFRELVTDKEYRYKTATLVNGQVTAVSGFSAWTLMW